MKNKLLNFFLNKQKCKHKNALLTSNEGYCPDCGQYLIKSFYIVRCACCDIKRESKISWGEIVPAEKYCSNCGSNKYYIEKLESINLIDANFAVYLKEPVYDTGILHPEFQVWVDEDCNEQKLLGLKPKQAT